MSLLDKNPSMVDGLGHAGLENKGLEAALEKVLDGEGEDVIKLVLCLIEETVTEHPSEQRLSLEDPARVLLVEGEEVPRVVADAAERVLHPPQLSLAPKPVSHRAQTCPKTKSKFGLYSNGLQQNNKQDGPEILILPR